MDNSTTIIHIPIPNILDCTARLLNNYIWSRMCAHYSAYNTHKHTHTYITIVYNIIHYTYLPVPSQLSPLLFTGYRYTFHGSPSTKYSEIYTILYMFMWTNVCTNELKNISSGSTFTWKVYFGTFVFAVVTQHDGMYSEAKRNYKLCKTITNDTNVR